MDITTVTEVIRQPPSPPGPTWRPGDAWLAGGTWLFSDRQPDVRRLIDLAPMGWTDLVAAAKRPDKPYPNSGAVSACGGRLGGVYRVERDLRQYRCNRAKWRADTDERCGCPRLDADWLDGQVWHAVANLLSDPDALEAMADDYLGITSQRCVAEVGTLTTLERNIAELERAVTSRVTEALRAGLPAELLAEAVAGLGRELEALKRRRESSAGARGGRRGAGGASRALHRLATEAGARLPSLGLEAQREVLSLLRLQVELTEQSTRSRRADPEGELPGGGLGIDGGGPDSPDSPDGLTWPFDAPEPGAVALRHRALSHDHPVRAHPERLADEVGQRHRPAPSTLAGRASQPHDVRVVGSQLAGVLHQDTRSSAGPPARQQGGQQRRLAGAGAAADQEGLPGKPPGLEQPCAVGRQRPAVDQLDQGEAGCRGTSQDRYGPGRSAGARRATGPRSAPRVRPRLRRRPPATRRGGHAAPSVNRRASRNRTSAREPGPRSTHTSAAR